MTTIYQCIFMLYDTGRGYFFYRNNMFLPHHMHLLFALEPETCAIFFREIYEYASQCNSFKQNNNSENHTNLLYFLLRKKRILVALLQDLNVFYRKISDDSDPVDLKLLNDDFLTSLSSSGCIKFICKQKPDLCLSIHSCVLSKFYYMRYSLNLIKSLRKNISKTGTNMM